MAEASDPTMDVDATSPEEQEILDAILDEMVGELFGLDSPRPATAEKSQLDMAATSDSGVNAGGPLGGMEQNSEEGIASGGPEDKEGLAGETGKDQAGPSDMDQSGPSDVDPEGEVLDAAGQADTKEAGPLEIKHDSTEVIGPVEKDQAGSPHTRQPVVSDVLSDDKEVVNVAGQADKDQAGPSSDMGSTDAVPLAPALVREEIEDMEKQTEEHDEEAMEITSDLTDETSCK